jgi:tripartite-type tricarboxylate transporter receptor subunit TctC
MTTSGNHILTPLKNAEVGYTYEDFAPVGQIASRTMALVVRDDAPWQTLEEFIQDAKSRPGEYTYGSVPAVLPVLVTEDLADKAGIELVHVPQQGDAPGATALLGGDLDLLPASLSSVAGQLESGNMRALAVFNEERDPSFPDVPTAKEQGYDVVGNPFTGPAVAEGLPEDALQKLRATLAEVVQDPAFLERAQKAGTSIEYADAETFGDTWARDWSTYEPVLRP